MATVSIREAKNRLTELARRVERGERITVTRNGRPVMELVAAQPKGGIDWEAGERWLKERGITRTVGWISPDFDDPLPEDFLITPITYPDEK
jgi:prevent-host-death family protein